MSLDPRVNRLPVVGTVGVFDSPVVLDQFATFEVFVQGKVGKAFQHEGAVHAPNLEMAFLLAKETFTRRFTCISMYVAATSQINVSPVSEGATSAYDLIEAPGDNSLDNNTESYEIYHMQKRGKQHVHVGTVNASSSTQAMQKAKEQFNSGTPVQNVWALKTSDILFTKSEEKDMWLTLPEKKFRDASDYKGGDKLKDFLEERQKLNETP